jgi:hypothetical protein
MSTQTKAWYRSKTLWANVLTALAMVALAPEVQGLLGPDALKYVAAGQAVINIALRFLTHEKLVASEK